LAKQDDTAPSDLRDLLAMLRDALGQPPLGALLAALAIRTIRLLAEQDLGKRMAMREQIPDLPHCDLGRVALPSGGPGPGGPGRLASEEMKRQAMKGDRCDCGLVTAVG
jgi:hypothetical protein